MKFTTARVRLATLSSVKHGEVGFFPHVTDLCSHGGSGGNHPTVQQHIHCSPCTVETGPEMGSSHHTETVDNTADCSGCEMVLLGVFLSLFVVVFFKKKEVYKLYDQTGLESNMKKQAV